jgi:hypothetical protein
MSTLPSFLLPFVEGSVDEKLTGFDPVMIERTFSSLEKVFKYPIGTFSQPSKPDQLFINRLRVKPYKSIMKALKLNLRAMTHIDRMVNWTYNYVSRLQPFIDSIYNPKPTWFLGRYNSIDNNAPYERMISFQEDYVNLESDDGWGHRLAELNITLLNKMKINTLKLTDSYITIPWNGSSVFITSKLKNPYVKILDISSFWHRPSKLFDLEKQFPNLEYLCFSQKIYSIEHNDFSLALIRHYLPKGIKLVNCNSEVLNYYFYGKRLKLRGADNLTFEIPNPESIKFISNFDEDEPQLEEIPDDYDEGYGNFNELNHRFMSVLPRLPDSPPIEFGKSIFPISREEMKKISKEDPIMPKITLFSEESEEKDKTTFPSYSFDFGDGRVFKVPERIISNSCLFEAMIGDETTGDITLPMPMPFSFEDFKKVCEIISTEDYKKYPELVIPETDEIIKWLSFNDEITTEIIHWAENKSCAIISGLKSEYSTFSLDLSRDLKGQMADLEEMDFWIGLQINPDETKTTHFTKLILDNELLELGANYQGNINLTIINRVMTKAIKAPLCINTKVSRKGRAFPTISNISDFGFELCNPHIQILELFDNREIMEVKPDGHRYTSQILNGYNKDDLLNIISKNPNLKFICGPKKLFNVSNDDINEIFDTKGVYIVNSTAERLILDRSDFIPFFTIHKPVLKDPSIKSGVSYADRMKTKKILVIDRPEGWEKKIKIMKDELFTDETEYDYSNYGEYGSLSKDDDSDAAAGGGGGR